MNRYTADYSSSPASTPNYRGNTRRYGRNDTPELASTTPLAPPPSHPFGSSAFGGRSNVSKLRFTQNARDLPSGSPSRGFGLSTDSQGMYGDDGATDYTEDMMDDDYEDEGDYTQYTQDRSLGRSAFDPPPVQSLMKFSTQDAPQTLTRSSKRLSSRLAQFSTLPNKGNENFVPGLVRDIRKRLAQAELATDPDSVIIDTEQVLRSIAEEGILVGDQALDIILADSAKELEKIWEGSLSHRRRRKDENLSIGPGPGAPPFEKARFIAILLLRLYNFPKVTQDEDGVMSMPQILLDWLNEYHMTIENVYTEVTNTRPNPTASDLFWDLLEGLTARGKFELAMKVLSEADFNYALKEVGGSFVDAEYTGMQLQSIEGAILQLRQILNTSPALQSKDWQIDGPEWLAYRRDVEAALDDLRESTDTYDDEELREAEEEYHFSRPGKELPYDIFLRLQTIYNILLGSSNDLIAVSNDWLEASMLLTVWWNGTPNNRVQQWSFDVSRAHDPTQNDELGTQSYLTRLRDAFLCVSDPASRSNSQMDQLNPQSPFDLALASILQGDIQSALALLQSFSLCITSSLAELGSWSGWLSETIVPDGLDKDDLMVLTNGASNASITKDEILEHYAHELFERPELQSADNTIIEGWEVAISVVSRCDSKALASRTVQGFLGELSVDTADRAQRLITLCTVLGLREEARRVSEQYGDHLVNNSSDYGTALLCYARSGAENKLRQLIDLLNSYCLVQSKAYPSEAAMDTSLARLVSNPKEALANIAEQDPDAVEVLQFYLVGYACLRRYYTTRDSATNSSSTSQKKIAAKALVAAINSAADCIYGGLYDASRQSAIQVDGLLTLLGEATALTAEHNNGNRVFSSEQLYAVLAAVEDLQTVSDRVYAATEECLNASLRQFHGSLPPSPHAMLKKSMSSGTNSNFSFSLMGSEMLAQSSESLGGKSLGSAVLVGDLKETATDKDGVQRGWDWRSYFRDRSTTGADVLQCLRRNIAQELSIASLEEGI